MKIRSVLKKLKKKTKKSYDGVVKDPSYGKESEEMGIPKPKLRLTKIDDAEVDYLQDESFEQNLVETQTMETNSNKSRIQSHIDQLQKQIAKNEPKEPTMKQQKRTVPIVPQSVQSSTPASKDQSIHQFQDDFGVEKMGFAPIADPSDVPNTWASFGDSRGFFNNSSPRRSGSIFTESTAPTESESSLASPTNSSFESHQSNQELHSSFGPSSSHTANSMSSRDDTQEDSPKSPVPVSPPKRERRSDTSLPLSESLQVKTPDQRQRASPTSFARKDLKSSPPPSSQESKSAVPKRIGSTERVKTPDQRHRASPTSFAKKDLKSSPPPPPSSQEFKSAVPKRTSITERYTAALNTSTSSEPSKLYRTRSKKSVLDNHPLYRKRSMVEKEEIPPKQEESRELPEAETSPKSINSPSSIPKNLSSNSLSGLAEDKEEEEEELISLPQPSKLFEEDQEEEEPPKEAILDDKENADVSLSSIDAEEVRENVLAEATMEQQDEMPQDELESFPKLPEDLAPEDVPSQDVLFTAPELDGPQYDPITAETAESASKATTLSANSQDESEETAPIGELSFDSRSHHSLEEDDDGSQTQTLDYTYDPSDAVSLLSEGDYTFYTQYTQELSRSKRTSDRFSRWVENTIFDMANYMCPMGEEGDVYDA